MRLDTWLLENGLVSDLKDAVGLLLTGNVLVNDKPVTSPGFNIKPVDIVRLRNQKKWVARSAEKLAYAIHFFGIDLHGRVCLDAGASTGGFTEVMLANQASLVYSIDVAYGFLHPSLRSDPRVVVMERTHICELNKKDLNPLPDFFAADLSFISIKKVLLCLKEYFEHWEGIVLFKPQFEVSPENLENGIVKSQKNLEDSLHEFEDFLRKNSFKQIGYVVSPIKGRKGNTEYLFYIQW